MFNNNLPSTKSYVFICYHLHLLKTISCGCTTLVYYVVTSIRLYVYVSEAAHTST